jgi:hypothetical protein
MRKYLTHRVGESSTSEGGAKKNSRQRQRSAAFMPLQCENFGDPLGKRKSANLSAGEAA